MSSIDHGSGKWRSLGIDCLLRCNLPKFSSSATRLRAMLGMACRYQDLLRRRSRVAPTQPELSALLSAADPRLRRSATAIMEALPRLDGRQRSRTSAEFACEVLRHGGFGGRPILLF